MICPRWYMPDGSSRTPEGDPNMTTACCPSCPSTIAIHWPAQSKDTGSAIGTSPRFRSLPATAGRSGADRRSYSGLRGLRCRQPHRGSPEDRPRVPYPDASCPAVRLRGRRTRGSGRRGESLASSLGAIDLLPAGTPRRCGTCRVSDVPEPARVVREALRWFARYLDEART